MPNLHTTEKKSFLIWRAFDILDIGVVKFQICWNLIIPKLGLKFVSGAAMVKSLCNLNEQNCFLERSVKFWWLTDTLDEIGSFHNISHFERKAKISTFEEILLDLKKPWKHTYKFFFNAPNFSKQSIYSQPFEEQIPSMFVQRHSYLSKQSPFKTQSHSNNPHEEFCLSCKVSFEFLKGSPPTPPILKGCILNIRAMILNFPTQKQSLHLSVNECFILEGELLSWCRGCARVLYRSAFNHGMM